MTLTRIMLVARNVFRGVFHRRILYLWFLAIGLLLLRAAIPLLIDFGSPALQDYMRRRSLSGSLDTWSSLCIALAIFMGATAIGSEISGKTIVSVFARPIQRWEFLVGKWVGVQAFALLAFGVGLLVGIMLGDYVGAEFESRTFGFAVAQSVAAIILYSGMAIALGTVLTPGVAGALTVIVVFLPAAVEPLRESERAVYQASGAVLDYVVPPGYTSHYSASVPALMPIEALGGRGGFGGGRTFGRGGRRGIPPFIPQGEAAEPEIENDAEVKTLLQNLGYAALFFGLGSLGFLKRDLRLG